MPLITERLSAGHFFSANLSWLFKSPDPRGTALEPWERRIWEMWHLVKTCHVMPWEHDLTYEEGERTMKPEDKADLLQMDRLEIEGANYKQIMAAGYQK
jgi:hypothetical protein